MLNIAVIWTVWQTACKNVNIIAFFYLMRVNTHPVSPLHRWDSSQLMRAPVENVCCGSSFKVNMRRRKDSKGFSMQLSLFLGLHQVLTTAACISLSNSKKRDMHSSGPLKGDSGCLSLKIYSLYNAISEHFTVSRTAVCCIQDRLKFVHDHLKQGYEF